jgi:hypothetical protein
VRENTSGAANVPAPAARNKDRREIVEGSSMALSSFVTAPSAARCHGSI